MATSTIDTIVLGYEGSDASRRALERTATLAQALGARVVVASVVPALLEVATAAATGDPLGPAVAVTAPTPDDLAQADRRAVEERSAALEEPVAFLEARGISAEPSIRRGEPLDQLLETAEEQSADLIVIGAEHRSVLERLLGGDLGQRVARKARCDVLIVHSNRD
jgi:nucleotide-binding universal stress UspA family protein